MQAGLWGQPHRDRVDPGSLGSGLAPLSGSLSAVHCVGLHCLASSAVSWWWAAFGLSQWSPGPVRNDSSWLFATVCGTDADVLRKEIPWDSRGPWTSWGRLWSASPWTPPPPHTPPTHCSDGAVQVTDGGHGDCVVVVVILHGLWLYCHQPVHVLPSSNSFSPSLTVGLC